MRMKESKIKIAAGETEPYIYALLSDTDALKYFNNRSQPFELIRIGEDDESEGVVEDEETLCELLGDTQLGLSIGYVPQDFLMNLQEITAEALDKLQASFPDGDRIKAARLIQQWAVEFMNHYDTYRRGDVAYYDAIDDFVCKKFDELRDEGYDVPQFHKVADSEKEFPKPKFSVGDTVWYMLNNKVASGKVGELPFKRI